MSKAELYTKSSLSWLHLGSVAKDSLASPCIPSPASGCRELPQKLFHVLHGSLLSISHFTCLNGRDHSAQVCLCSSSVLISPRRWDAVNGTSPLQEFEPGAHTGPGGAAHRNPCHGWLVAATQGSRNAARLKVLAGFFYIKARQVQWKNEETALVLFLGSFSSEFLHHHPLQILHKNFS